MHKHVSARRNLSADAREAVLRLPAGLAGDIADYLDVLSG